MNTSTTGSYTYTWTAPQEEGEYSLRAVAFPNNTQQSIYSNEETLTITAQPPATSMTLALPTQTVEVNTPLKFSGSIQPPKEGVAITLTYHNAEGQTIQHTTQTALDGSYTDTLTPTTLGSWMIQAAIEGTSLASPPALFNVKEPEPPPATTTPPPQPLTTETIIAAIIIAVIIISLATAVLRRRVPRPPPTTAIMPTVSQLLAEPPEKVAESLLKTSTLDTAKIMTLLPADRAAEVIKAMKEKTREEVEEKTSRP